MPQVRNGINKERLIKTGNSDTEERATAHLKTILKIIKDENSKNNGHSICFTAYACNVLYS
ncbi:MAG: hypothetical protein ABIN97_01395, partial [Ginsengibacter sp.]